MIKITSEEIQRNTNLYSENHTPYVTGADVVRMHYHAN